MILINKKINVMKKFFICSAIVVAATLGVIRTTDSKINSTMSNLQIENVELLAEGEPTQTDCYRHCRPAWCCYCDIADWRDRSDYRRCEDMWPYF